MTNKNKKNSFLNENQARIENKQDESINFWVNRSIDLFFIIVIIVVVCCEVFVLKNDPCNHPNYSNFLNAVADKFYVNNIIVILCPLMDTIVDIAFSVYNDEIYGYTIWKFKNLSRYSGYGFVEIMIISILLVGFAVLFYYLDLILSDLVVNIIALLYCLYFTIMDISLLARSKWRLYMVLRQRYKYIKKTTNKRYIIFHIRAFDEMIKDIIDRNIYTREYTLDKVFLLAFKEMRDFSPTNKYETRFIKKLNKYYDKLRDEEHTEINIDTLHNEGYKTPDYVKSIYEFLLKSLNKSYKDKHQALAFSKSKQDSFYSVSKHLMMAIFTYLLDRRNEDTYKTNFLIFVTTFENAITGTIMHEEVMLDPQLKILIGNAIIEDGVSMVMKKLKMESPQDIITCLSLQNEFLPDAIAENRSRIDAVYAICIKNIQYFIPTRSETFAPLYFTIAGSYKNISIQLANSIFTLCDYAEKYDFALEFDTTFQLLIYSVIPLDKRNIINYNDIDGYVNQFQLMLCIELLKITSLYENLWFYLVLNDLYRDRDNVELYFNFDFYIFASIYLYNLYYQPYISETFRNKIEDTIRRRTALIIYNRLLEAELPPNEDRIINILKTLYEMYELPGKDFDWNAIPRTSAFPRVGTPFNYDFLTDWWFDFVAILNASISRDSIDKLRDDLGQDFTWRILIPFYKHLKNYENQKNVDIDMQDDSSEEKKLDYFGFFGVESLKDNKKRSLAMFKGHLNNMMKEKILSKENLDAISKDLVDSIKKWFSFAQDDFSKFVLFNNNVSNNGKNTFRIFVNDVVDYNDVHEQFDFKFIYDAQKKIIDDLFKFILNSEELKACGAIKVINDYDSKMVEYIKKKNYNFAYMNFDNEVQGGISAATAFAACELHAEQYLQGPFKVPYDIFFNEDAIRVNIKFDSGPKSEKLKVVDYDNYIKSIEEKYGFPYRNYLTIKNGSETSNDVFVEFSKNEVLKILLSRQRRIEFSVVYSFEINPKNILVVLKESKKK